MDMVIPETLPGMRDALMSHMMQNYEKFTSMDSSLKGLWSEVKALKKHEEEEKQKEEGTKMASETINVGGGMDNAAMMMAAMANRGGDGFLGNNGLIGGLILGSLLRNNGNLFGNNGDGAVPSAVLRSPPEQTQANMDLMAAIGQVDKAVAVSTAAMEASQAQQSASIVSQLNNQTSSLATRIDGTKEAVNASTMVLAQQLNGVQQQVMQNRYELAKDITNDGDKTRALITSQYEATLNRQLGEANAAIIELRSQNAIAERTRGVEVTTTNNINQAQAQQQQQQQWARLADLVNNLANDLQYIRATNQAINVGNGTLTANPANTNTNIR